MLHAAIIWLIVFATACFGAYAIPTIRNRWFKALVLLAFVLLAAGGTLNAIVMSVNGGRMPVEDLDDWSGVTRVWSEPSDLDGLVCWLIPGDESADTSAPADDGSRHRFVHDGDRPRLARLDDRHHVVICGQPFIYSIGDVLLITGLTVCLIVAACAAALFLFSLARQRFGRRTQ